MISSSQGGSTGLQIAPREHELYNRELGAQRTVARSAAALLGGHTSPPDAAMRPMRIALQARISQPHLHGVGHQLRPEHRQAQRVVDVHLR